jgi:hypothetical protein
MCTADPTGLPYSFGTGSLQSDLITHTGTPGNHNRLLHVCMVTLSEENFSISYTCTTDPTGLPSSFGTDSLQSHLITYTGTPGNHNRLIHVCMVTLSEENFLLSYTCTTDPTGLPFSFGTDSLQSHLITRTRRYVNIQKMCYRCKNLLLSYMCTADPTGISHLFGTDSLQLHLVTYTELVKYT